MSVEHSAFGVTPARGQGKSGQGSLNPTRDGGGAPLLIRLAWSTISAVNGGVPGGRDVERQAPFADHDQRGRGARIDAGLGFGELVFLLGHLHLQCG